MWRSHDSVSAVVGREKLKGDTHAYLIFHERCHARSLFHALRKGKHDPQLALSASWERVPPAAFAAYLQGRTTWSGGFSVLFL